MRDDVSSPRQDQDLPLRAPLRRGFISVEPRPVQLSGTSDSWEAAHGLRLPRSRGGLPRRRTKGLLSPQCGILQRGIKGRTTPATAEPQDPLSWGVNRRHETILENKLEAPSPEMVAQVHAAPAYNHNRWQPKPVIKGEQHMTQECSSRLLAPGGLPM
ncbi:hypothetical protein MYCTH_2129660 [Thermothelomyces thermophilus ATCC 42464]|uniref:Uncharacterized protein n=1 Tax=Thermothelomyces thermophilus (strain ATCC 42464 / BCRC 31852 / DSM 1799) TaxID=573729 RepID=G2QKS3_THET4|nr:uncharacterized protein MYCTH_2129660 [Thermothelomyces thermophilus ATCC 42464]AEO60555.1 hypothetical protein MYCTH_2129660 [Thermothelomyces thermophilus ATCC 42464]